MKHQVRPVPTRSAAALATLTSLTALLVAACGGSSAAPSIFDPVADAGADAAPPNPSGSGQFGDKPDAGNENATLDFDTACATSSAAAVPRPAYLVYMFDRSGSMANNSKWTTVTAAMKSFFGDPRTEGLQASLTFFPADGDMCSGDYASPLVPMMALPSPAIFSLALDTTAPNGKTPTVPALKGAIAYAEKVYAEHAKDGRVVVVFVTDGNPDGCESTVPAAGAEAYSVSSRISTYVVGIGSNLSSLNYIAKRGNTTEAILVSDANPAKTADDFVAAMDKITRESLSCEYGIPAPKEGDTVDFAKVNVQQTTAAGKKIVLPYNRSCTGGAGWAYDDSAKPTKIILCGATCKAVSDDRRSKVDLLFGCKTNGDIR